MRKIDSINQLKSLGLRVAEAREFRADQFNEMNAWADYLTSKYGTFNIRTDLPAGGKAGINLPFIMGAGKEQLTRLVNEWGERVTYILHQHFDLDKQLFNATLRLCDGKLIGELNDVDKTSQRAGMLKAKNLKRVCCDGESPILKIIKDDLTRAGVDAWLELTAYKDGSVVYWQIVPERMTEHLKNLFFSTNVTT